MAHVELSLPDAFVPLFATSAGAQRDDSFSRWVSTVAAADEPGLVIDTCHKIVAASVSCCSLLGLGSPAAAVGRPLVGGTLRLVDFTAARGELADPEIEKIPPLLAITSGRLARGLLRVQSDAAEADATVDAIATPLFRNRVVAGSLTFFSEV
ncbi:MAG TPA: hypothetical protein VF462_14590 [Micromonosporaceae bacterium]